MNSRERVLSAIDHRQPNRLPIDFGGHRSSGISVQAYIALRKYLNLPPSKLYVYDFIQQLVLIEEDVYEKIPTDVVQLGQIYLHKPEYWKDWTLEDGMPCKIPSFIDVVRTNEGDVVYGENGKVICIKKKGSLYFEQTYFPYADSEDEMFEDLEYQLNHILWWKLGVPPAPAGFDDEGLAVMRADADKLRHSTDRAIYAIFGGSLVETAQFAFRIDNFMCEMALNPQRIHTFLDKLMDIYQSNLQKFLSAVGSCVDIIGFGDDMGMQSGTQFSVEMYREFFRPRHEMLWKSVRRFNPNLRTCLHCCGSIAALIPDMIAAGIDCINPVQINCADMSSESLKSRFGKDLTFWGGGCDANICMSSPTDVIKKHVEENISVFEKEGGFIFSARSQYSCQRAARKYHCHVRCSSKTSIESMKREP